MYSDTHNTTLRERYNYPRYLVSQNANFVSRANSFEQLSEKEQLKLYEDLKSEKEPTSLQAYEDLLDRVRQQNANNTSKQEQVKLEIEKERKQFDLQICNFHDPLVMLNSDKFVVRQSPIADKFF